MPNPQPLKCEFDGCDFVTDADNSTKQARRMDLALHVMMVHKKELDVDEENAVRRDKEKVDSVKLASKLDRPMLGGPCSEAEWALWSYRWASYKRACGLSGPMAFHQLNACLEESLLMKVFERTHGRIETEEELLKEVKKIVCKTRGKVVQLVEFFRKKQKHGESVNDFRGRLEGGAQVCDFVKTSKTKCNCGCGEGIELQISYKEDMVAAQLILGLENTEWQEKALAFGESNSLDRVNDFLNTLESARDARDTINKESEVAGIKSTDYKKKKNDKPQMKKSPDSDKNKTDEVKCRACGGRDHISSVNSRRHKCPAFDKECTKCKRIGHFAKFCLTKS